MSDFDDLGVEFGGKRHFRRPERGHGRGRGRGKLRQPKREYRNDRKDNRSPSSEGSNRPPPGLRGKALGLWYRDHYGGKRRSDSPKKARPTYINLKKSVVDDIKELLEKVKAQPPPHLVKKYALMNSANVKCKTKHETKAGSSGIDERLQNAAEKYSHLEDSRFKTNFINSITGTIESSINRSLFSGKLKQNPEMDDKLREESLRMESSHRYQEMLKFRMKLPSFKMRQQIVDLVSANQVVVISGETGCGKTTQVAQFILDSEIMNNAGSKCHIVCTQPRRISAISVAERVAEERGERVGYGSVGYQIRLEKMMPREKGSILFVTTGVLLQYMQSDPALSWVSHVIIDEIHERSTESDFVITILKSVIERRKDLKLILMSATLNSERFSDYYGKCPMLKIPGFTFPVEEYYLEDVLQMTNFQLKPQKPGGSGGGWKQIRGAKKKDYDDFIFPHIRKLEAEKRYSRSVLNSLKNPEIEEINLDLIMELLEYICFKRREEGAILIFLPGWDKINALNKKLNECGQFPSGRFLIIPLHSMLPTMHQKSVFNRPPRGVRKIVIATNIAETSITIDDIVFVIDCGKIKIKNFDIEKNITTLQPEWVSLANAHQRRGRAGRVQKGVCYHLYSKAREMTLARFLLPEMLRTRLEEVILQGKILQLGSIKPFLSRVLDPPDPAVIDLSLKMLLEMNALDSDESLTPLGHHLAQLPVDPQVGKMLLMASLFSCVDPIMSVGASLGYKDAFVVPMNKEKEVDKVRDDFDMGRKSDHLLMAEVLSQWEHAEGDGWDRQFCNQSFLVRNTLTLLRDMKKQFSRHLHQMKFLSSENHKAKESNVNSGNVGLLRAIICSGLYPNVAVVKKVKFLRNLGKCVANLETVEDGKVEIHPRSVNSRVPGFESKFIVYHLKLKSSKIFLHDTTMVHPLPMLFFGHSVNMCEEDGKTVVELSDKIRFAFDPETAKLILELRIRLDWILEQKISNPGVCDWKDNTDEGAILRAITLLITAEDDMLMIDDFEETSD